LKRKRAAIGARPTAVSQSGEALSPLAQVGARHTQRIPRLGRRRGAGHHTGQDGHGALWLARSKPRGAKPFA
jgi:hypothetical protein